jgi:hypothetical protein
MKSRHFIAKMRRGETQTVVVVRGGGGQQSPQQPMSFFVTSVGKGDGANYGGLAGADAYCQSMAMAAGRGSSTWHAYLSTQGPNAVNARARIGMGPWYNPRSTRSLSVTQVAVRMDELEELLVAP